MRRKTEIIEGMGSRIQQAREAAGMTQAKLAERIDVTTQFISDLERSVVGASVMTLRRICTTCSVSSDYLLFGNEDNTVEPLNFSQRMSNLSVRQKEIMNRDIDIMFEALYLKENTESGA